MSTIFIIFGHSLRLIRSLLNFFGYIFLFSKIRDTGWLHLMHPGAAGLSSFSKNIVVIFVQPLLTLIERRKSILQLEPIDQTEVNTLTLGGQLAKN